MTPEQLDRLVETILPASFDERHRRAARTYVRARDAIADRNRERVDACGSETLEGEVRTIEVLEAEGAGARGRLLDAHVAERNRHDPDR
jgi:hypothetical protein